MYHTALEHGKITDADPLYRWTDGKNAALVHDVALGLPVEFDRVDLIYGEPPWADGYEEFNRRAGMRRALPFNEWLYRLNGTLALSKKPWVVLVGAAAMRHLGCEWVRKTTLNGGVAALMGARVSPPPAGLSNSEDVLLWLSGDPAIKTVGDFCAGYGRTCRIFAEAGKNFVASDSNANCIGHIAREAPAWTGRRAS